MGIKPTFLQKDGKKPPLHLVGAFRLLKAKLSCHCPQFPQSFDKQLIETKHTPFKKNINRKFQEIERHFLSFGRMMEARPKIYL
jgi:hypothetical protein